MHNAVAEAAAAAISLGKPNLALEWLEQGRSIVWGQILQLRTPLNDLHQRHPDAADELERVSRALESAGTSRIPNQLSLSNPGTPLREVAQTHRRLAEEYERVVGFIRRLPDFGDFLLPKKCASLCSAAVSGPIVVVTPYDDRCDALILLPNSSQVTHIALRGLRLSDMSTMQLRLAGLIQETHITKRACGPYEEAPLPKWDEEMLDILGRLWMHIVEPILLHLKVSSSYGTGSYAHGTDCWQRCFKSL